MRALGDAKVFGTGMQRTGTTSLARAFQVLNLVTRDHPKELMQDIACEVIHKHQAFTDNPIPFLYQELDKRHPGSRFIHTERDDEAWLKSVKWLHGEGRIKFNWHMIPEIDEINMRLYQRLDFDADVFLSAYQQHNLAVREYFKDRPDDLLILDITKGEGFEEICSFLGLEHPGEEFPHRNLGTQASIQTGGLRAKIKRALGRIFG
jgi:hypothetical protein